MRECCREATRWVRDRPHAFVRRMWPDEIDRVTASVTLIVIGEYSVTGVTSLMTCCE